MPNRQALRFLGRACVAMMLAAGCLLAGCTPRANQEGDPRALAWSEIVSRARGQTVYFFMWRGDPAINHYVDTWVASEARRQFGIELKAVDGQGNALVNALLVEKQSGVRQGSMDLMWINGETFAQLRSADLLYHGWGSKLPNASLVRWSSPFIARDFGQKVDGDESPWGNVQMAILYDSVRVSAPPRTYAELATWVHAHPGRFTYDRGFTGLTFLKGVLGEMAGGYDLLAAGYDSTRYQQASAKLWKWLDGIRPDLWRHGESYPASVGELHRLFANGEVDFSMSNNDAEVDNKVLNGALPPTTKSFIFDSGTIQNSHYVGIPRNAPHKAAAMVVADLLLSPEAQYEKLKPAVWADGTVLDVSRLSPEWRARFEAVPARIRALPRATLDAHALPELAPQYMMRLAEDWRIHELHPVR